MDFKEYTHQNKLERYAFLWSEARLLIASVALFLGGIPVLIFIIRTIPFIASILGLVLTLSWIISGVASAYLLYKWLMGGRILFGGKARLDTVAFLVSVISGLNLGIVGLFGTNVGMNILSNRAIFAITALIYIASAYHLHKRWKEKGENMFGL